MDKEMKKLLLVAVSVGVFLLVTITVALIVITPRAQADESINSSSTLYSHGKILPAPDLYDEMIEKPVTVLETDPGIESLITSAEITVGDSFGEDKVTIQITPPTTAAVPENTQKTSAQQAQKTTSVKQTTTAPAASKTTAAAGTSASKTKSTSINDYWIQIGAYRAMIRAEDAKELLASNGLISIIENREVNGQSLYRVRLGPYTSENEANHWLAIVKNIAGFSDSQVRQSVRTQ